MIRRTCCLVPLLAAACSTPEPPPPDPAIEEQFAEQRAASRAAEEKDTYQRALLAIDQSLDKYAQAKAESGIPKADQLAEGLERFLRQHTTKWYRQLLDSAIDASVPRNQAIAVAALGFSGQAEARDPIVNALRSPDPIVAANAGLGLAVLRDPQTPIGPLAELIEDAKRPVEVRTSASYALMVLQDVHFEPAKIWPVWVRVLGTPMAELPGPVALHAIRGLGLTREPEHAKTIEPYLAHPFPLVRAAAAVALGWLKHPDSWQALLATISPAETNANVRLAGRKALQTLASGADREYDVAGWRKFFEQRK